MDANMVTDSRVLELRQQGRSFKSISERLGLERPADAWVAFNRALRRHAPEQQASLRDDEMGRLQVVADGITANETLTADEQTRRLASVDRMRQRLLA